MIESTEQSELTPEGGDISEEQGVAELLAREQGQ